MAVEHLKSTALQNADAAQHQLSPSRLTAMELREAVGVVRASASASIGSTYRIARVPSNARISQILFASAASGATGQVDIGLYDTPANGGAVVDADFFASALDPGGGAIPPTDVTHESGVFGLEDAEQPLWQALGLTKDPQKEYDIAATVVEAFENATYMVAKVRYGI
nr:MAG: hypothetical protein DIU56_17300 [Pseudomonadota bacterium]